MKYIYLRTVFLVFGLCFALFSFGLQPDKAAQVEQPESGGYIAWKPDGTEMGIFAKNGIFIYDRQFNLSRFANYPSAAGSWSSDGTKIFADNRILAAKTLELITDHVGPFNGWLKDGSQFITISGGGFAINIWDSQTNTLVKTIASPIQLEFAGSSPDGNRLFSVVANIVVVFDTIKGSLIGQYILPVSSIESYIWGTNSLHIAYIASPKVDQTVTSTNSTDPRVYTLNIMDTDTGKTVLTSKPILESVFALRWNKNLAQIVGESTDGQVFIWETDSLSLKSSFALKNRPTGRLDYSPFGGVLVIGTNQKGNNSLQDSSIATLDTSSTITTIANDQIQIIVPEVSTQKLESIVRICGVSSNVQQSLITKVTKKDFQTFSNQVTALTNQQILQGCKADLLAVTNALMAKAQ